VDIPIPESEVGDLRSISGSDEIILSIKPSVMKEFTGTYLPNQT
jgi:hypothetical protein